MARDRRNKERPDTGYSKFDVRSTPKPPQPPPGTYIREWRGRLVMQAPGRPPTPDKYRKLRMWQTWLRLINWLYKMTDPRLRWQYKQAARGIWLQPRDIFAAATAGTLFYIVTEDGRKIFSERARDVMSESLDIIAQKPGSLLVRGAEFWQALLPGPAGYVLTSQGPDAVPAWQPVPSGGGGVPSSAWLKTAEQMWGDAQELQIGLVGYWLPDFGVYQAGAYFDGLTGKASIDVYAHLLPLSPTNPGDVVFEIEVTDATPGSTHSQVALTSFTVSLTADDVVHKIYVGNIALTGNEERVFLILRRLADDPGDTYPHDLYLLALEVA